MWWVICRFLGIVCGHLEFMEMVRISGIVGIVLWTSGVRWDCPWTYGGWGTIYTGHWGLGDHLHRASVEPGAHQREVMASRARVCCISPY